jgi:glycerate kinase
MKILIVPDSFKGSLSAQEVALSIKLGVLDVLPSVNISLQPIADGGEGTLNALMADEKGVLIVEKTYDSLFREIEVAFGVLGDRKAIIEVAQASGLPLLAMNELNPLLTSSFGTGKQVLSALNKGVTEIVIGLGGSATNDAGIGILHALGYRFYDNNHEELQPIGESLIHITSISDVGTVSNLNNIEFSLLVDVTNPLFGEKGAAYIFAPQKGADKEMVGYLDAGLRNFHQVACDFLGKVLPSDTKGFGAAGGMAFGLVAFLDAKIVSGIEFISIAVALEQQIKDVDLVISGEGKVDEQSLRGKVISGISQFTTKHNKPFVVIGGVVELSSIELNSAGVTAAFSVSNQPVTLVEAMKKNTVKSNIRFLASQLVRLFNVGV